ncbi:MAG: hypothetical protein K8I00_03460 [Candidatus Omnitrophica bacterium]|nr:hypothetical protein [Candidatus Omnitrophota bacterium]
MKFKNIRKLERLGIFTYIGGLICTLLGILVAGIHLMEKDFKHIQVGIFILAIGYAFVKTGRQLSEIAAEEKKILMQV